MRTEQEMMGLILATAKQDERIRAVYMNGSRTNPNVPKDLFQDYDVVYVVEEIKPFIQRREWLTAFGGLLMMQEPDKNDGVTAHEGESLESYMFLMLFNDGNRIDLRLQMKECMQREYGLDKLTCPLLDKDGLLPAIPAPTDCDYHVVKPSEEEYNRYTNDFWWCSQNVAKGIWRDELPYAKHMFEQTMRVPLELMISWWIGIQHDFHISTGKLGKYVKNHLPKAYWEMYEGTYSDSDYSNMWEAVFTTCELFRILARDVADHFDFTYPLEDDQNMMHYLQRVRNLPADAVELFPHNR
ncbi:aminoglycoside 6-adenylyltransferase [Pradoshia sp.]|uniref:aminoglycoside 6-adenylyltransferase n=1 Tax=Pradoshia sp. TaxID=2651281 RepID=UPI003F095286